MRRLSVKAVLASSKPENGSDGHFEGLASTFGGEPDAVGDIIAPGAFADSLAFHDEQGTRPALLWCHDQTAPIGAWERLEETPEGLVVEGQLALDTSKGAEAYALMKQGALSLSIGYVVRQAETQPDGSRLLLAVDLIEISVVPIPANHHARITSVKAFDPEAPNPRNFERAARDALGLSAREAKRLMSGGWSGLVRDEQTDPGKLAALAAEIKALTNSLRNI